MGNIVALFKSAIQAFHEKGATHHQTHQLQGLHDLAEKVELPRYHRSRHLLRFSVECSNCHKSVVLSSCEAASLFIKAHLGHHTSVKTINRTNQSQMHVA